MLFEGLRLASQGRSVTFIDRADVIGGAWRTRALFDVPSVEVGVHLVENRVSSNAALEALLGRERLIRRAAGFGLIGRVRVPLPSARVALYGGLVGKALLQGDLDEGLHACRNSWRALREIATPLIYPVGGFAAALAELHERLLAARAQFLMLQQVDSIAVTPERIELRTGSTVRFAVEVVMSSRAHAPIEDFEHLWAGPRRKTVRSVAMVIDPDLLNFQGYVEIFGNRILKRVRDLTEVGVRSPAGAVLIAQLRRSVGNDTAEASAVALCEAHRLGLLRAAARPLGAHLEEVVFDTLSDAAIETVLRRFSPRLRVLKTVDFGDVDHYVPSNLASETTANRPERVLHTGI